MKDPFGWREETDLKAMKDVCFYWMTQAQMLYREQDGLLALLEEKGYKIDKNEWADKINEMIKKSE